MFRPDQYGPALAPLLVRPDLNELGPGEPNAARRPQLDKLSPQDLGLPDGELGRACIAGIWLLHDFLHESHEVSQQLDSASGAFWHGVMHRREGDYGNAKYWFCRVGIHPIFQQLAAAARPLAGSDPALAFLTKQTTWDPNRFIDLCRQAAAPGSPHNLLARKIQRLEWELLFDYCYREAAAEA